MGKEIQHADYDGGADPRERTHNLHVKTMVGATYFPPKLNSIFARYFRDAGFTVRAMEGIDVPFDKVQELSSQQIYAHIKRSFLRAKGADAIYMLGSGWRTLDII